MNRDPKIRQVALAAALALAGATLVACGGGDDDAPVTPTVPVGDTVALTASGKLISFNRATPATLVGSITVNGLASGETLLGIDVRPADGTLYGLGSLGSVYKVDPATGAATSKVTLKPVTGDDNPYAALSGTAFGVDFNPVADRLRVVSNTGQNLRINVDTGDATTDGAIALSGGAATVTAAAYTNSFAGTSTTQLFDIDAATGLLHLQDPPNNGTLGAGLALGATGGAVNGFDIDGRNNIGFAAFGTAGSSTLYSIDLATGVATSVGVVAGGEAIAGLALRAATAPTAVGLTTDNRLVSFDPKAPTVLTATVAITGLASGESVLGIDVRPADSLLYALTSAGKVYTVNTTSGAATLKATLAADPADLSVPYTALAGTAYSVDFNPVADRLRVISDTGLNLRINVDSGLTTTDGVINRAPAATVYAAAYANSFAGTTATSLYDLEGNSDVLSQQNPPNNGTLVDIGALGVDLTGGAAFDIGGGANGLALAAFGTGGVGPFLLYSVNLTTGALTLYRNTTGTSAPSQIGGASGPALRDLALRF